MSIIEELEEECKLLKEQREILVREIRTAPDGGLKICNGNDGVVRYYNHYYDESGKVQDDYLSISVDGDRVYGLAQKKYNESLLKIVEKEIRVIENFINEYRPDKKREIYEKLTTNRKLLVSPYYEPVDSFADQWDKLNDYENPNYKENLQYKTERGELVRSKSEVIIANYLHSNRDKLYYKYEYPLYLMNSMKTIYPDFTIMSRVTGEIVYLEHAGMIGMEKYGNDFVKKIEAYARNGIFVGDNLLYTFESTDVRLNTDYLKRLLKKKGFI